MQLNEKLEEAIERTTALEGDAQGLLGLLDRLDGWAGWLQEVLEREGARLHTLLEEGAQALEDGAAALASSAREAGQDLGVVTEEAANLGRSADAMAEEARRQEQDLRTALADARRETEADGARLDAAYTETVAASELLDIAVVEQVAAAADLLGGFAGGLDTLATACCQAVASQVEALQAIEAQAAAAVDEFESAGEEALAAAGRALYGLAEAVARQHRDAVRAFGDAGESAPADSAGVALRMIAQAPFRAAQALRPAALALEALQGALDGAEQSLPEGESPVLSELAAQAVAAAATIVSGAEAVPPPSCARG